MLIAAGILFVALQMINPLQFTLAGTLAWKIEDRLRERAALASFGPIGVAALEDPETFDTLADLGDIRRGTGFSPGWSVWSTLLLGGIYLQWALAAVLIGVAYTWWAALLLAGGSLALRISIRTGFGRHSRFEATLAAARRRRDYFWDAITAAGGGKEIRIFGLSTGSARAIATTPPRPCNPCGGRAVETSTARTCARRRSGSSARWSRPSEPRAQPRTGRLTLGELAYVLQGHPDDGDARHIHRGGRPRDRARADGVRRARAARAARRRRAPHGGGTADATGAPRSEIRFEHVTFGYGDGSKPVLRDLDLTIEAGRSLAIVGLNGAGKTTLVKLLARLYEPQAGRILVDGVPLAEFPVREWRRRVAASPRSSRTSSTTSCPSARTSGSAPSSSSATTSGSAPRSTAQVRSRFVDALPHGLDTTLSREYPDGAEMSGGQWQRIAIARALMAVDGGAGVLVLDEPTASLDVRAEAGFFDRFLELTRGLTTILISHRFSTVRRAERIVVLEHGRVIEDGTHDELLAADGRYAELFHLQAARFQS